MGVVTETDRVRILKDDENCPDLPIVDGRGRAWAVVWPGVGATFRSLHRISLDSESRTIELSHPMEAVYYVMAGTATVVDGSDGSRHGLVEGSMAYIDPETAYLFEAGADGAELLGGPCPPDPTMYAHIGRQGVGYVSSVPSPGDRAASASDGSGK